MAENYLVLAFSMFDRQKKGYINTEDLKEVFEILGESITDEEVNTMIKIAGIKSNDKINFKEFVDFFYKID
jgi:Ca2+-binding EF-hand superfamily protein